MPVETVLETERLMLTNWLPEHYRDLTRLHGDPEVARHLTASGKPENDQQSIQRIANWATNFAEHRMGKLRLIRKSDGVLVGRAGFGIYPPTGEPEIGYALFREQWGQGYAFEAALALRDWIFRETERDYFIGLAAVKNTGSLRILTGIGMVPTELKKDTDGALCQFHIYRRQDWQERNRGNPNV